MKKLALTPIVRLCYWAVITGYVLGRLAPIFLPSADWIGSVLTFAIFIAFSIALVSIIRSDINRSKYADDDESLFDSDSEQNTLFVIGGILFACLCASLYLTYSGRAFVNLILEIALLVVFARLLYLVLVRKCGVQIVE